jgi:3-phenylpropionate/trans-cinnamate dioxygenase ferredoxin reductase subunit
LLDDPIGELGRHDQSEVQHRAILASLGVSLVSLARRSVHFGSTARRSPDMTADRTLAIVGASLAGAKAAEAAREAGFDGRVVLIGDEDIAPYERPPLSKAVLRGEDAVESTRVHPDGFYTEHDIDVVTDQVTAIDTSQRTVHLARAEALRFDTAVISTGAEPRPLTAPGAELSGVHYLRTADDSLRLSEAIRQAARVAVVGAGWIGAEVAASARAMGADVVLIEPAPTPLHRVLGEKVGRVFAQLHADHGVELRLGTGVQELRGTTSVREVVLDDARVEPADLVVVGVGVTPRAELAAAAALAVDNGIVVDEYLETSAAGVFAAGDVANSWHPHYGRHIRVEHWANALNQGLTAGRNAVGRREAYDRLPYFFSDQYDLGMEYVGFSQEGDAVAVRGDLDAREFIAFWHRNGVVTAAMNVNIWDVVEDLKAVVASGQRIAVERLTDPEVALSDLA